MMTLVGNGTGQRPVLGWAVNVTYLDRRPTIDTATIARLRKSIEVDETALDIVLVVDRIDVGLWMPLPLGSTLVGIVTQQPFPVGIQNPLDIPCVHVSELPDEAFADGMLVLVDPLRQLVLVEPTADELVRIQITRKTRYAIGDGHIPVHTRGGVNIPIYAEITTESDIALSLSQGADGLVILTEAALKSWDACLATGSQVWVAAELNTALDRTGTTGWVTSPNNVAGGRLAFQAAVSDVIRAKGIVVPPLRIVDVRCDAHFVLPEDAADNLLCDLDTLPIDILSTPPCWVVLTTSLDAPAAVIGGAAGLVVPAAAIAETKDILRHAAANE
ncbi:MAG: hypothetical protein RJB05_225 [Armatimonadota bacterium]